MEPPEDRSGASAEDGAWSLDAFFAAVPLEGIGVVGLVIFAGLVISRGWWVPASTVKELTSMRDDRIKELAAERDDWKAAANAKDEALRELAGQNNQLLELAETGNALMRGLIAATGRDA